MTMAPSLLEASDLLSRSWYRGQLQGGIKVPERASVRGFAAREDVSFQLLRHAGFSQLYEHEVEVVRALGAGDDLVLGSLAGPEPYRIGRLVAGMTALQGGTVLGICPDEQRAESVGKGIAHDFGFRDLDGHVDPEALKERPFAGVASVGVSSGGRTLGDVCASGASIGVTTPSQLFDALVRQRAPESIRDWLRQVNLIWVQRFDRLAMDELIHLGYLLEAHRWIGADPQYFGIAGMLDGLSGSAEGLFGRPVRLIRAVGLPRRTFQISHWLPPLEADGEMEPDFRVRVRRRSFGEELQRAVGPLAVAAGAKRVLVWDSLSSLVPDRLRRIRENLVASLAEVAPGGEVEIDLRCVRDPDEAPSEWFGKVDLIVLAGWPTTLGYDDLLGQLGALVRSDPSGGHVVHMVLEDPLSNAILRGEELGRGFLPSPALTVVGWGSLDDSYARWCCWEERARIPGEAEGGLSSIFLEKERIGRCLRRGLERFRSLSRDRSNTLKIQEEDDGFLIRDVPGESPFRGTSWPVAPADSLVVRGTPRGEVSFHRMLFPFRVFPGALVHIDGVRYEVDSSSASGGSPQFTLAAAPDVDPGEVRSPVLQLEITATSPWPDTPYPKVVGLGGGAEAIKVTFQRISGRLTPLGYCASGDGAAPTALARFREVKRLNIPPMELEGAPVLELEVSRAAVEIATLFDIYLRGLFPWCHELIAVVPRGDATVQIVASDAAVSEILERLFRAADSLLPQFASFAYWLLQACPCAHGCPRCLDYRYRSRVSMHDSGASSPSKANAMRVLGAMSGVGASDAAEDIEYKEKGLPVRAAGERYDRARGSVLECLETKIQLTIASVAELEAKGEMDGSAIGLYYVGENRVEVLAPLPEARAWEVIAHEYAHNWQFKGVEPRFSEDLLQGPWPHDGKLFLEGFAQWVAFKTDDFLGLRDYATEINVRVDDEYGDGFALFRNLENEVGFGRVLEFVREASVELDDGNRLGPEEVIQRFAPPSVRSGVGGPSAS